MRSAVLAVGLGLVVLAGCDHDHDMDRMMDGRNGMRMGSGHMQTQMRAVHGFHGMTVGDACQVVAHRAGTESLEVTAEDDVLPFVQAEVRDGRLVLGLTPGHVMPTRGVVFHLGARDLDRIEASGASRVDVDGIEADRLVLQASGASSLTVRGVCVRLEADLSGASRCLAEDLASVTVTARASGASYARLRARDLLDVEASGASVVEYLGSPRVLAQVTGGSVVRPFGGE